MQNKFIYDIIKRNTCAIIIHTYNGVVQDPTNRLRPETSKVCLLCPNVKDNIVVLYLCPNVQGIEQFGKMTL